MSALIALTLIGVCDGEKSFGVCEWFHGPHDLVIGTLTAVEVSDAGYIIQAGDLPIVQSCDGVASDSVLLLVTVTRAKGFSSGDVIKVLASPRLRQEGLFFGREVAQSLIGRRVVLPVLKDSGRVALAPLPAYVETVDGYESISGAQTGCFDDSLATKFTIAELRAARKRCRPSRRASRWRELFKVERYRHYFHGACFPYED